MWIAVVYESLFGNTRRVAEAIAEGIREATPGITVECRSTETAEPRLGEADLLIVGCPTHFLGMPSARSRRLQRQQEEDGAWHGAGAAPPPGVREWLESLPAARRRRLAATFDTRLWRPMPGSAARQIARSLRKHGYEITDRPQGFVVEDYSGPLAEGEAERARAWGAALAAQISAGTGQPSR